MVGEERESRAWGLPFASMAEGASLACTHGMLLVEYWGQKSTTLWARVYGTNDKTIVRLLCTFAWRRLQSANKATSLFSGCEATSSSGHIISRNAYSRNTRGATHASDGN